MPRVPSVCSVVKFALSFVPFVTPELALAQLKAVLCGELFPRVSCENCGLVGKTSRRPLHSLMEESW